MNEKQYKKMFPKKSDLSKKIINCATYVVDHDCTMKSGEPIVGDERVNLIAVTCMDMAFGEKITKRKHLLTGCIIGVAGTFGLMKIQEKIKNREKESN